MRNISSSTILDDSTIVAIATPAGIGAISIIRLSGADSYNITLSLTHKSSLTPRYAHLCAIYDKDGITIDEAIVIFFPKPHSYTTQDVCEIQCHGGVVSARAIVELCYSYGARESNAGEFTKRAFLGGRIDLSQAQAIANLINSHSIQANKMLMRQLKGELGVFVKDLRENLLEILAFSEVHIDYSEEVQEDYKESMIAKLNAIISKLDSIYELSLSRQSVIEGYTLSIVGKPNVGKSSLLNALLGAQRAIVSEIAGTTRDTIEENITIDGNIVRLVDTAGMRESGDEIEQIGIHRSKEAISRSDIVLALFDGSRALDEQDLMILDILRHTCKDKYLFVLINKNDLPQICDVNPLDEILNLCHKSKQTTPLLISLKHTREDITKILDLLRGIISAQSMPSNSVLLTSAHQLQCVKIALEALRDSQALLQDGALELFSYKIIEALDAIVRITKPYENDELLDKLFSNFCLGK